MDWWGQAGQAGQAAESGQAEPAEVGGWALEEATVAVVAVVVPEANQAEHLGNLLLVQGTHQVHLENLLEHPGNLLEHHQDTGLAIGSLPGRRSTLG